MAEGQDERLAEIRARLEELAENIEHAEWLVDNHEHTERGGTRERCTICDEWWPCDTVMLAALAVKEYDARTQAEAERDDALARLAAAEAAPRFYEDETITHLQGALAELADMDVPSLAMRQYAFDALTASSERVGAALAGSRERAAEG